VSAVLLALAPGPVLATGGAELDYAVTCQGCHLADGRGTDTVPRLAGSVARFLRVPGGREYVARVPGVAQAPLDDAATAVLLNWVLDRFDRDHIPADFVPYSANEIATLRRSPLVDVEGTRRRLLDALQHPGSAPRPPP